MRKYLYRVMTGVVGAAFICASPATLGEDLHNWPSKVIRIILPFSAGGINDVIIRIVAAKTSAALGQTIIVESKTGASGVIGTDAVVKSPPDGYTWLASSFPLAVTPALFASPPFDPVKDLRAAAMIATAPNVLVVSSALPVNTVRELVAFAKAAPAPLTYAVPGVGSSAHIGTEVFSRLAGFPVTQVLYKGAPPALVDVLAGRVTFMLASVGVVLPHIKSGKLKALAVMDSKRSAFLPEVPSIAEAGYPGAPVVPWFAVHVPAATPEPIVQRINREIVHALADPEVRATLEKAGATPAPPSTPAEIDKQMQSEVARWQEVAKQINLPKQ